MSLSDLSGQPSLSRLLDRSEIPSRAVGIFWLGGPSLVLKSPSQRVYLFDPEFSNWNGRIPVGAIDVRPDVVIGTGVSRSGLDISTLTRLAAAFPDVRFVASEASRDEMIGRSGHVSDEVPINPARVHEITSGDRLNVRSLGIRDSLSVDFVLDEARPPEVALDLVINISGIRLCLIRGSCSPEGLERHAAKNRRIDVVIWTLESENLDPVCEAVAKLHPRNVIPIGYDRLAGGVSVAKQFKAVVSLVRGVKVYLFPEDYLEGFLYSRIMSRQGSQQRNTNRNRRE